MLWTDRHMHLSYPPGMRKNLGGCSTKSFLNYDGFVLLALKSSTVIIFDINLFTFSDQAWSTIYISKEIKFSQHRLGSIWSKVLPFTRHLLVSSHVPFGLLLPLQRGFKHLVHLFLPLRLPLRQEQGSLGTSVVKTASKA